MDSFLIFHGVLKHNYFTKWIERASYNNLPTIPFGSSPKGGNENTALYLSNTS